MQRTNSSIVRTHTMVRPEGEHADSDDAGRVEQYLQQRSAQRSAQRFSTPTAPPRSSWLGNLKTYAASAVKLIIGENDETREDRRTTHTNNRYERNNNSHHLPSDQQSASTPQLSSHSTSNAMSDDGDLAPVHLPQAQFSSTPFTAAMSRAEKERLYQELQRELVQSADDAIMHYDEEKTSYPYVPLSVSASAATSRKRTVRSWDADATTPVAIAATPFDLSTPRKQSTLFSPYVGKHRAATASASNGPSTASLVAHSQALVPVSTSLIAFSNGSQQQPNATSTRILQTLDRLSTPLLDAKKIRMTATPRPLASGLTFAPSTASRRTQQPQHLRPRFDPIRKESISRGIENNINTTNSSNIVDVPAKFNGVKSSPSAWPATSISFDNAATTTSNTNSNNISIKSRDRDTSNQPTKKRRGATAVVEVNDEEEEEQHQEEDGYGENTEQEEKSSRFGGKSGSKSPVESGFDPMPPPIVSTTSSSAFSKPWDKKDSSKDAPITTTKPTTTNSAFGGDNTTSAFGSTFLNPNNNTMSVGAVSTFNTNSKKDASPSLMPRSPAIKPAAAAAATSSPKLIASPMKSAFGGIATGFHATTKDEALSKDEANKTDSAFPKTNTDSGATFGVVNMPTSSLAPALPPAEIVAAPIVMKKVVVPAPVAKKKKALVRKGDCEDCEMPYEDHDYIANCAPPTKCADCGLKYTDADHSKCQTVPGEPSYASSSGASKGTPAKTAGDTADSTPSKPISAGFSFAGLPATSTTFGASTTFGTATTSPNKSTPSKASTDFSYNPLSSNVPSIFASASPAATGFTTDFFNTSKPKETNGDATDSGSSEKVKAVDAAFAIPTLPNPFASDVFGSFAAPKPVTAVTSVTPATTAATTDSTATTTEPGSSPFASFLTTSATSTAPISFGGFSASSSSTSTSTSASSSSTTTFSGFSASSSSASTTSAAPVTSSTTDGFGSGFSAPSSFSVGPLKSSKPKPAAALESASSAASSSSLFTSAASTTTGFGSGFGASATTSTTTAAPSSSTSLFGGFGSSTPAAAVAPTTNGAIPNPFGAPAPIVSTIGTTFGGATSTPTTFGATPSVPTTFGASTASVTPTATTFGATPSSTGGFGASTSTTTGSAWPSTAAPTSTSFGSTPSSTTFGGGVTSSSTGFGTSTTTFGSGAATTFGSAATPVPSSAGFNTPSFGAPTLPAASPTFSTQSSVSATFGGGGGGGGFGSSGPAPSSTTFGSGFGGAVTSSSTPSSFGAMPSSTTFGSTPSTSSFQTPSLPQQNWGAAAPQQQLPPASVMAAPVGTTAQGRPMFKAKRKG